MEGERQHRIDRRQFLKGAVETAVGGALFLNGFGHLTVQVLKEIQVLKEKGILTKAKSEAPEQGVTPQVKEQQKAKEGHLHSKNLVYLIEEVVGGPLATKGIMDTFAARHRGEAPAQNGQSAVTQQ